MRAFTKLRRSGNPKQFLKYIHALHYNMKIVRITHCYSPLLLPNWIHRHLSRLIAHDIEPALPPARLPARSLSVLTFLTWECALPMMESPTPSFDRVEADANLSRYIFPPVSQKPTAYLVTALMLLLLAYVLAGNKSKLPRYNPAGLLDLTAQRVQAEFMPKGKEMLIEARKTYGQQPYRLHSDVGDVVVFPGEVMQEIRNNPALGFMEMSNYVCIFGPTLLAPSTGN